MNMQERSFGNINRRHVMVRWWDCAVFRLPFLHWMRDCNNRCYCPCGIAVQFGASLFGRGFIVFYSRFTAPTPCVCDRVFAEMFPDEDLE